MPRCEFIKNRELNKQIEFTQWGERLVPIG
jgi:hypothetical protein